MLFQLDRDEMHNTNDVIRLRRATDHAPRLSGFDTESGLAGRELLLSRLEQQWEACQAAKQPMGLLLVGIDDLDRDDRVNTNQLSSAMKAIGQVVSHCCRRRSDFAGRTRKLDIGVMLPAAQISGARNFANTVVEATRALGYSHPTRYNKALRVSVGGAVSAPRKTRLANSMIVYADRALQAARASGGDTVVLYSDISTEARFSTGFIPY